MPTFTPSRRVLAWLNDIDPKAQPDRPPVENLAPEQTPGTPGPPRLRGKPTPLLTIDTGISSSIDQVVRRRGAEELPKLNLDYAKRQFTTIVTLPDDDEDYTPRVYPSPDDGSSPTLDKRVLEASPPVYREIRPEDFARDPSATFAPRTDAQNCMRRERDIIQMQLETDDFDNPDKLHAFIRHAEYEPTPLALPPLRLSRRSHGAGPRPLQRV